VPRLTKRSIEKAVFGKPSSIFERYCHLCGERLTLSIQEFKVIRAKKRKPPHWSSDLSVLLNCICCTVRCDCLPCDRGSIASDNYDFSDIKVVDFDDVRSWVDILLLSARDGFYTPFRYSFPMDKLQSIHMYDHSKGDSRCVSLVRTDGPLCGAMRHYLKDFSKKVPCWCCGRESLVFHKPGFFLAPDSREVLSGEIQEGQFSSYTLCEHCNTSVQVHSGGCVDEAENERLLARGYAYLKYLMIASRLSGEKLLGQDSRLVIPKNIDGLISVSDMKEGG